jgi:tripartite-type tricarboxylate transporter receptor subunit TctC
VLKKMAAALAGLCALFGALAVVLVVAPVVAHAADYPERPVTLVVGFPPGGASDIMARILTNKLSGLLGQPFVVDNRPGAGGNVAGELVAHAAPDGYTLLLIVAGNTINGAVYKNLNYDFARDIAPVASIGGIPLVMVVTPSLPVKTVPEFIAYAKANPGKIDMASSGNGSVLHVSGALFGMMAGVDLVHVPYRDSLFPDLLAGQVQVAFNPVPAAIGYIQSGKLRALGVSMPRRLDVLPDVPAIAEFVPGFEANGWLGLGAPKDTPADVVDALNKAVNRGLSDPKFSARLNALGVVIEPMSPSGFADFIGAETRKWAKVAQFAHITGE